MSGAQVGTLQTGLVVILVALVASVHCAWLYGKGESKKTSSAGYTGQSSRCSSQQTQCWCGMESDQAITIIQVKHCRVSTSLGPLCEPCVKASVLCERLQNCSRCQQVNPHAICAECPADKYGLHCEEERPCKTPPLSDHMTVHPHFNRRGDYKLEFRCTGNKVRHGPRTMKCLPDGTWNKLPPKCVPPKPCPAMTVSPIPFTQVKHRSSDYVLYACQDGYAPSGNVSETALYCNNGVWVQREENVQCEAKGCPKLVVERGSVTYEGGKNSETSLPYVPFHASARVTCNADFVLEGQREVTCLGSGQWQPPAPLCVVKRCEETPHGKKCIVLTTSTNVIPETDRSEIFPGETVSYRCRDGTFAKQGVGDKERVCIVNGTLSGTEIQCESKIGCKIDMGGRTNLKFCTGHGCSKKPLKEHSHQNWPKNWVPQGTPVEFLCSNAYYRLNGDIATQCMKVDETIRAPYCTPECGKQRYYKNPLIMGGEETRIQEWPWQAGLFHVRGQGRREAAFLCGATLVFERWALTAAHCVTVDQSMQIMRPAELRLAYGVTFRKQARSYALNKDGNNSYVVDRILTHPRYNNETLDNDIALVRLKNPVTLDFFVGLACLPATLTCSDERLVEGQEGTVTGWGVTKEGMLSDKLRSVNLRVANRSECESSYKKQSKIRFPENFTLVTDNMFCAKSNSDMQDATDGDSGGPFVIRENLRWVLEGIVSWGAKNSHNNASGTPHQPPQQGKRSQVKIYKDDPYTLLSTCPGGPCSGVYTRVANYLSWIRTMTGKLWPERCA